MIHSPKNAVANCTIVTRIYPLLPKALLITSWYEKQPTETPVDTRMYSVYSVTMPTNTNKTTPILNPASLIAAGMPMIPDPRMELIMLKDAPTMPLVFSDLLELDIGSAHFVPAGSLEAWERREESTTVWS